jgi:long-chain acyl-CoA synthetase
MKLSTEDVFLSFLPLAHILDYMVVEYFFHKGASAGYYHGILKAVADLIPLRSVFNALYNP